jgi:P-type Cu2+ transporter
MSSPWRRAPCACCAPTDAIDVRRPDAVHVGDTVLVASGERVPVDGVIARGETSLDQSVVTGESVPIAATTGARVFAGTLNLGQPIQVETRAAGEGTLLAEIARLMEAAERGQGRYVALADRVARLYAPVVHVTGAATFLGWYFLLGAPMHEALMYAVAVLIITCPCALALAVPVVQVVASARLMRGGVLMKSATALERLAEIDTIVFDKTGTLTRGQPVLVSEPDADSLRIAAGLAQASRHPLARALVRAAADAPLTADVREHHGAGLAVDSPGGEIRLGSRRFCDIPGDVATDGAMELWLVRPGARPVRFAFSDAPREDAAETVAALRARGIAVRLLSGDREPVVREMAERLGIESWRAGATPAEKAELLAGLAAEGRKVAMIGDGLNDGPALAAAHASLSPANAVDIAQVAADFVFQGDKLRPVVAAVDLARDSQRTARQNLVLAMGYNALAVPLAIAGYVTPLVAAIAMSSSSVIVILNALRLSRGGE